MNGVPTGSVAENHLLHISKLKRSHSVVTYRDTGQLGKHGYRRRDTEPSLSGLSDGEEGSPMTRERKDTQDWYP